MNKLQKNLEKLHEILEGNGIRHKLIGGFALSAMGVPRTTVDIDFLVAASQKEDLKSILNQNGFKIFHESNEVIQFTGDVAVDFLLAHRPVSLEMLSRPTKIRLGNVSVISPEDFIGLKIQAYKNSPKREFQDKADIQNVIEKQENLDWEKIQQYAEVFGEWQTLQQMKNTTTR